MYHRMFRAFFVLILVIGMAAVEAPHFTRAAGPWYVATTGNDGNDCLSPSTPCGTINGAINKASNGDTINVATGIYFGTGNEVVLLEKDIILSGGWNESFSSKSGMSTIDGEGARRGMIVFSVTTVESFIIRNGTALNANGGGGIITIGTLTLNNSTITGNSEDFGGGILNGGTLTLNNSTISGNSAATFGGGILNSCCGSSTVTTLTLNNSIVSGNTSTTLGGGGIANSGAVLIMNNSTVSGNSTPSSGGGILNSGGPTGTVTLNNSSVSSNSAITGGGIYNSGGSVSLNNSIVSENVTSVSGSGIRNLGILNLTESIVMNNSATDNGVSGAGISNEGTTTMSNSSIVGNTSTNIGAGINNFGVFRLVNSTVSGNSPGGIANSSSLEMYNATVTNNVSSSVGGGLFNFSIATLQNTIISGNFGSTGPSDCFGTLTSGGYNLIQETSGCTISGDTTGNIFGIDPMLGPLQDNGGPTPTHALLTGSSAIDAGSSTGCRDQDGNLLTDDQRGVARPQGAACDIGAFELVAANPVLEVDIDIKPGSAINPVNMKSNGRIPVAILSTIDFTAPAMVDRFSLTFGKTGDETSLAFCDNTGSDVNFDGLPDLVCHFYTQSTGFQPGDVTGVLRGSTTDGTPLEGTDGVKILK